MPDRSELDPSQFCEDSLRNFILLTLPLLSLQREMLKIVKNAIEDGSSVKPTERFAVSELQALMMIVDRSRTLRSLIDEDLEKSVEDACKEIFPKMASASIQFIEAQDRVLAGIFEALKKLRSAKKASNHSSKKGAD